MSDDYNPFEPPQPGPLTNSRIWYEDGVCKWRIERGGRVRSGQGAELWDIGPAMNEALRDLHGEYIAHSLSKGSGK